MKLIKKKILILIVIIITTYFISSNFFQLILINGDSMYPTYYNYQIVLLLKYGQTYKANDVVAFQCDSLDSILIKRIVALPGDCVWIKDGILYVNEISYNDQWENAYIEYSGIAGEPIFLAGDEYFVLGDNYKYSKDSRYVEIGCIEADAILGKIYP